MCTIEILSPCIVLGTNIKSMFNCKTVLKQTDHCPGNRRKVRENEKGLKSQDNSREFEEEERGKSRENLMFLWVQTVCLSFHQNAISRSQGK